MYEIDIADDSSDAIMAALESLYPNLEKTLNVFTVRTLDGRFIYATPMWYLWQNINSSKFNVVDRLISEIPSKSFIECGYEIANQHHKTVSSGQSTLTLQIHEWLHKEGWRASLSKMEVLKNDQGKKIGLVAKACLLQDTVVKNCQQIRKKMGFDETESVMILETPKGINNVEFNDLFLLMMGTTPKEISFVRNVHSSVVYKNLDKVRDRHKLSNNKQLIDFAVSSNWHNYLPPILRNKECALSVNFKKCCLEVA